MAQWTVRIVAALVLLGASGWCGVPGARAEPLVIDRPVFAESAETVGAGRLQLDARAGIGPFNGKSPDYFVGVGVAWRFRAW